MGFDLYGQQPKNENGKYFRNNVWWYRPLWQFIKDNCEDILNKKDIENGDNNSGHLISKSKANEIAERLETKLDLARELRIEMEKDQKPKRKFNDLINKAAYLFYEEIVDKQNGKVTCPGDLKTMDPESYKIWSTLMFDLEYRETSYPFHEDNVKEFIQFCKDSGGYTIC